MLRGIFRRFAGADTLVLLAVGFVLFFVFNAIWPGAFATHDPNKLNSAVLAPPSREFLLGTDDLGRDIWSRLVYGSRIAMFTAASAMLLSCLVGVPLGLLSGMYEGLVDGAIMRALEAILAFPVILFAILIAAAFGPSIATVILTMTIVYVPRFARLVRGNVLTLKEREFVLASRACGARNRRIMFRTLLPNCMAPIIVQATLGLAFTILTEATLSYLGLGVQPPTATWGTMLQKAQRFTRVAPWYVLSPGACIFIVVLTFNFLGDRLRDRLDPKLRGEGLRT
jgi:ABC-type dipeptide/oligopeptide/nickel transport system permease subunit